jgi:hypothetical protein
MENAINVVIFFYAADVVIVQEPSERKALMMDGIAAIVVENRFDLT